MNTTTTKIAGEAMTDEQIAHLWDCSEREGETILDGYAREIRFARALLASKPAEPEWWQPMATAPRDGSNILIRFGRDGVSQAKYVAGTPHPWKFIDTNDGITWLINHAVDTEYGPTHWMPMPDATAPAQSFGDAEQADEAVTISEHVVFAWLVGTYVQRADDRQKSMGLQYTEAETHDLAKQIVNLIARTKDSK